MDNAFNVNKTEDNILSENILSTMQVLQKHFRPVECKSIDCLLTDNISLDRASQLTGITKKNISRYRNLKNKNKIFEEFEKKRMNENFQTVLDAWGDVNVMTILGKSPKRMPQRRWNEIYEIFLEYYKSQMEEEEVGPSFEWFK